MSELPYQVVGERPDRDYPRNGWYAHRRGASFDDLEKMLAYEWRALEHEEAMHDVEVFVARYKRGDTCTAWGTYEADYGELPEDEEDNRDPLLVSLEPQAMDFETLRSVARSLPEDPAVTRLRQQQELHRLHLEQRDALLHRQRTERVALRDALLEDERSRT